MQTIINAEHDEEQMARELELREQERQRQVAERINRALPEKVIPTSRKGFQMYYSSHASMLMGLLV